MAELTAEIDHIYDQAGNILYLRDTTARESIDILSGKDYPEGYRIYSKKMIAPNLWFGGEWTYEASSHGFEGLYIYTRNADEE